MQINLKMHYYKMYTFLDSLIQTQKNTKASFVLDTIYNHILHYRVPYMIIGMVFGFIIKNPRHLSGRCKRDYSNCKLF